MSSGVLKGKYALYFTLIILSIIGLCGSKEATASPLKLELELRDYQSKADKSNHNVEIEKAGFLYKIQEGTEIEFLYSNKGVSSYDYSKIRYNDAWIITINQEF